ncbi:MAG: hypothetical protein JWO33_624 [Caulobacteraceae bacterium]|nr:hypothetical protein [Caulobacteraceae bacterium]
MEKVGAAQRTAASVVVFRLVLAGGLLLSLAANLPGHLSLDSVIALEEARTQVRQTWAPAAFSWLLRLFDQRLSGTGLYVTATSALLFLSLMGLAGLRPRTSWLAAAVAVAAVFTPQLLIYPGIVWRDVAFADLSIAGFVCLAYAAQAWGRRGALVPLIAAFVLLALGAAIRQNGVLLVLAAAVALGWTARAGGRRAGWAWGLGGLAAMVMLTLGINHTAQPADGSAKLRPNAAGLILQHYDVVGAVAHEPGLPLEIIGRANPAARQIIETDAARLYSPERVDTLDTEEGFRKALWKLPDAAMTGQWRAVILHHPRAYIAHRLDVFTQVFLTPDLAGCLPIHVGVTGPAPLMADLGMVAGIEPQDARLARYAARLYATPVYSHLTYALIALAVSGLLWLRRSPADGVIIALQLGSLVFTASFLAISVACDYRYLYVLDLAAITGLIYLALDPFTWTGKTRR